MSFDLKLNSGNIIINNDGDVDVVSGVNKARQDVIKMVITPQGSNTFHKQIGSLVNERLIGTTIKNETTMLTLLNSSVIDAVNFLIKLQKEQKKFQFIDPAEEIRSLDNISVKRDVSDPRQLNVTIYLSVANGAQIAEGMNIRL